MSSQKIYYDDQYVARFEARVVSCSEAEGDKCYIELNSTAFYPEGGGQPADIGRLYLKSEPEEYVSVLDTREKSGSIIHVTDAPISEGTTINGCIDWERRFSLMQHHTGEHIVSGLVRRLYGLDNVGFHMGTEFTTMDINGELTLEQIKRLELMANRAIYENVPVYGRYPLVDELDAMEYRSKKTLAGDVRIVTVEGYDNCACCGLHCKLSGEVGIIKIVQAQRYKSGMRFYMLCGLRAFEDYSRKNSDVYAISHLFSAKPEEIVSAACQCKDDGIELKRQLTAYKLRALEDIAGRIADGQAFVYLFEDNLTTDELRRLCMLVSEKSIVAAVFSGEDELYRYALGSACADMRNIVKRLNSELNGRGGGKKNLVQGTLKCSRAQIEEFCAAMKIL